MEVLLFGAEQVTGELSNWGSVFANLGVAGILGWYLYYTQTVAFPRLAEQHLARLDTICANHDKALGDAIEQFADGIREERATHRAELELLRTAMMQKLER